MKTSTMGFAGVALIIAGVAGLAIGVVPIHRTEEIARIGPLTATANTETDYVVPPFIGLAAILIGGAIVFAGWRRA